MLIIIEVGDYVNQDDVVALIETDKITIDIRCADAGVITKLYAEEGGKVEVGKPFYEIDTDAPKPAGGAAPAKPAAE